MKLSIVAVIVSAFALACSSSTSEPAGTTLDTGGDTTAADGNGEVSGDGGLASGQCRSSVDCKDTSSFCSSYTLLPLCGGKCESRFTSDCTKDSDCADAGTSSICDKLCACGAGGAKPVATCSKGCTVVSDCLPGQVCGTTHRCEPAPCTGPTECPANFACASASTGKQCQRKPCKNDGDCSGYCVEGNCSAAPGNCNPAVP